MNDEIVRLSAANFEEAMEVMNLAFDKSPPTDFENLLPKLYHVDDDAMACHYALRRNGAICAIVGLYPLFWNIGSTTLRMAGIGGVSTHPDYRGQGMMQRLMNHCVDTMKKEKYHLSWLGGQRQRYGYFGYETCGVELRFQLTKRNLRHCFNEPSEIRFEPLKCEQIDRIKSVKKLHDTQSVRANRSQYDFYSLLRSWTSVPYVALRDGPVDDENVGYLVHDRNGILVEIVGLDDHITFEINRAWVEQGTQDSASIHMGPIARGLLSQLAETCESTAVGHSANWLVFDWCTVITTLLSARHTVTPMPSGRVTISLGEYGTVAVNLEENKVTCKRVDEQPMLTCDDKMAHRLFFGPLPPSQVVALPLEAALLESWCPLPLFWPRLDAV